MYSAKEKLHHFRQLLSQHAAEADLALLHVKAPQEDFTRFDLSPRKNAEDILFALLNVATHDEIVRNRRDAQRRNEPPAPLDDNPADGGEDGKTLTPSDDNPADGGENDKTPTPLGESPAPEGEGDKTPTPPDETPKADGDGKKQKAPKKKKKSTPK